MTTRYSPEKSGKVWEFQSGQGKVRENDSRPTQLDKNLWYQIFFCSLRSHIIYTTTFEFMAPPLVKKQLLSLGVWCIVEFLPALMEKSSKNFVLWKVVTHTQ